MGYTGPGGYHAPPMGGRPMHPQAYAQQRPQMWQPGMPQYGSPHGMGGPPATMAHRGPMPMQQQQRPAKPGPPRREMDSLLEEIKAKQRLQEQKKENMKNAEARTAEQAQALNNSMPNARGDTGMGLGSGTMMGMGMGMGGGMGMSMGMGAGKPMGMPGGMPGGMSGGMPGGMPGGMGVGKPPMGMGVSKPPVHDSGMDLDRDVFTDKMMAPSPGSGEDVSTLYCKELPRNISEDTLCQLFSRYGVVTGVDILHAKEKQDPTRGYVIMDTRDNAQRAKDALHDRDVEGVPLWIEFAKERPESTSATSDIAVKDGRRMVVEPPIDRRKRRIIDQLAKYVSQEGHPFEQLIMERESPDGDFSFLFKHDSPDNIYYRWRTFAFAQGDNFRAWRTASFRICDVGGQWWIPPHCEVSRESQKKVRSTNFSAGPMGMTSLLAGAAAGAGAATAGTAPAASAGAVAPAGTVPGAVAPATIPAASAPAPAASTGPSPTCPVAFPANWTEEDVAEERERQRLEEKATQERQKRDRDKKGIAGGKRLSDPDWDRLESLLRGLTGVRSVILEAMVFCLDKSDFAIEITECITEALTLVETEMPLKLARLMVVSDILHNTCSSRPAAWAYRREFEKSLPDILEHFHIAFTRLESKIQQERYREQVLKILHVWEDWGLFAPQYTRGLEASLVVGVKSLRRLKAKGDNSREPAWLEIKLAEWKRQHFSQLEKMCRTRGLRSSTSHLEATKDLTLEDARRDWLIDRLVCYELHWHEKEQERGSTNPSQTSTSSNKKSKLLSAEDIDGEIIECDIDGFPLEDGDLDGQPMSTSDPGAILRLLEATRLMSDSCLGGDFGGGRHLAGPFSDLLAMLEQPQRAPSPEPVVKESPFAMAGAAKRLRPVEDDDVDGQPIPPLDPPAEKIPASTDDGLLDIERPEDPAKLAIDADPVETAGSSAEPEAAASKMDRDVLRGIELEVMELRASLETQGLHRDAIQDICDEKRQRLIDEHEATLKSPMNKDGGGEQAKLAIASDSESSSTVRRKKKQKEEEEAKEREVERLKELERERKRKIEKEQEEKKEKERKEKLEREKLEREFAVKAAALAREEKAREAREEKERQKAREEAKKKELENEKAREKEKKMKEKAAAEKDKQKKKEDKAKSRQRDPSEKVQREPSDSPVRPRRKGARNAMAVSHSRSPVVRKKRSRSVKKRKEAVERSRSRDRGKKARR